MKISWARDVKIYNQVCVCVCSGYMTREYLMHGQVPAKSDVCSFGVLEIVSGKRISAVIYQPGGGEKSSKLCTHKRLYVLSFISHVLNSASVFSCHLYLLYLQAWRCLRDQNTLEFMDPTLKNSYSENQIKRCIRIGLLCVQEDMKKRPTMENIVLTFNSDSVAATLSMPQYPAFLFGGSTDLSTSTSAPWSASEPSISEQGAGYFK